MGKLGGRVSQTQREKMLDFMSSHPELAKGRLGGPSETQIKKRLIAKLASILNAEKSGATKSADKWYKCWQDWKSDTKAKALKTIKYNTGNKRGPRPAALTCLEQTLLDLLRKESINKLTIQDTLAEYEEELEQFEIKQDPLGTSTSSKSNAPVASTSTPMGDSDNYPEDSASEKEEVIVHTDVKVVNTDTKHLSLIETEKELYETMYRCLRNIAQSVLTMSAAFREFGELCVDLDVQKLLNNATGSSQKSSQS